jgi:hypothetical protein
VSGKPLPPAPPGNQRAVTHGAYAMLRLAPRAAEIGEELRAILPAPADSDEITVRLLALTLAKIEAGEAWIAEHGLFRNQKGDPWPVAGDLNRWANTAHALAKSLGLTTLARAGLNLDHARTAEIAADLAEGRRLRLAAVERGELIEGEPEGGDDGY